MALHIISQNLEEETTSAFSDDDSTDTHYIGDAILEFNSKISNTRNAKKKIPTTAAAIKREYLLRDYSTQTDHTEILDIKYLQEMSEALVTDINDLRSETASTERHMRIQQDYIMKTAISELEGKHSEQIFNIQSKCDTSMKRVRRAAKQEVADIVAQIKADFMKWHEAEISKVKKSSSVLSMDGFDVLGGDMSAKAGLMLQSAQQEIIKLQNNVAELTSQLDAANNKKPEVVVDNTALNAMNKKYDDCQNKLDLVEAQRHKLELESKDLQTKLHDANLKMKEYQNEIENAAQKFKELEKQIQDLNKKISIERLEHAKKILELKEEFGTRMTEMENEYKAKIQELEASLKSAKDETTKAKKAAAGAADAVKQAEQKAKKEAERAKQEQDKLKKENEDNKSNKSKKKEDDLDLSNSAFSPEAMSMINGLKTKLSKLERMYEKKIEIMNNQMHTLKDENFIRQQLQRDSLLLHKVDVRYQKVSSDNARSAGGYNSSNENLAVGLAPNPLMMNELKAILPGISSSFVENDNRPKTTPGKKISDFQLIDQQTSTPRNKDDEDDEPIPEEFEVFEAAN